METQLKEKRIIDLRQHCLDGIAEEPAIQDAHVIACRVQRRSHGKNP